MPNSNRDPKGTMILTATHVYLHTYASVHAYKKLSLNSCLHSEICMGVYEDRGPNINPKKVGSPIIRTPIRNPHPPPPPQTPNPLVSEPPPPPPIYHVLANPTDVGLGKAKNGKTRSKGAARRSGSCV